ncbi:MAG: DnaA/Hda family protein [Alphaproteobacteria bacterium]
MTAQLALALPFRTAMGAEDFIVTESNRKAVGMIDGWPTWPARIMTVHGASGAGKTHLAQVWAGMSNAARTDGTDIAENLEALLHAKTLIIDNIDAVAGNDAREQALFHLCNHIQQNGFMLLTAAAPPAHLGIRLPDLRSRLCSYPDAALLPPDDTLLAALLIKQFSDRQLRVGQDVIDFLLPRIERSAAAVAQIVTRLDAVALERQSRVTVPLAREVLSKD